MAQHVIVRGNNRLPLFFKDKDRTVFLSHLAKACAENDCCVHSFVLMTNHVHLLATGNVRRSISMTMRDLGRRYVQYVNGEYKRTGTLFEGRFRSNPVEAATYVLTCMKYIELNPVRAGMVGRPGDHPWSSYGNNVSGAPSGLVTAHTEYLALGGDPIQREEVYRGLFATPVTIEQLAAIRRCVHKALPLGSVEFCASLDAIRAADNDGGVWVAQRESDPKGI